MARILVFGATSAIAQAAAREWATRGDDLYLVARDARRLEAVAADLRTRGAGKVATETLDANDLDGCEGVGARAEAALGGLDAALLAHGVLGDPRTAHHDWQTARRELTTNFLSVVAVLTPLADRFEERKSGVLCVIGSVAGDRGRQSNYLYGTAKAGVATYLQGLRNRLHPSGVAVVTVKPGFVDTPMTAHLKKGLLFASAEKVGRGVVRAMDKRKDEVYLPGFWRPVLFILRHVPEAVFKRLRT